MDIWHLLTNFNGRIDRKLFWLAWMHMMGLQFLFFAVASGFVTIASELDQLAIDRIGVVLKLLSIIPVFALLTKRLHDRDRPAYFVGLPLLPTLVSVFGIPLGVPDKALQVIPIVTGLMTAGIALWLFVELGFIRGTIGSNQYGPDPLAIDDSRRLPGGSC